MARKDKAPTLAERRRALAEHSWLAYVERVKARARLANRLADAVYFLDLARAECDTADPGAASMRDVDVSHECLTVALARVRRAASQAPEHGPMPRTAWWEGNILVEWGTGAQLAIVVDEPNGVRPWYRRTEEDPFQRGTLGDDWFAAVRSVNARLGSWAVHVLGINTTGRQHA